MTAAPEPGSSLTDADRAAIRAQVATWLPLTAAQREQLRPILAGTIPPREPRRQEAA